MMGERDYDAIERLVLALGAPRTRSLILAIIEALTPVEKWVAGGPGKEGVAPSDPAPEEKQ